MHFMHANESIQMGMTLKDVALVFRNKSFVKKMIRDGTLRPLIKGGRGCPAVFDPIEVRQAWDKLKANREVI